MKEVTINNTNLTIKDTWEEINLGEYIQIEQILKANISDSLKIIQILVILSGIDESVFNSAPLHETMSALKQVQFLQTAPKDKHYQKNYILNGTKYNLQADITKISTAQYIDYLNYMKETPKDLVKILSLWLVPDGHDYNDGYDIQKVFEDVSTLPFLEANAITFFLHRQFLIFMIIMTDSLEENLRKMEIPEKEIQKMIAPFNNMELSRLS